MRPKDRVGFTWASPLKGVLSLRSLALLVVVLLAFYVVLPQVSYFDKSFSAVWHANRAWLGLAAVFAIGTYAMASLVYLALAIKKIKYTPTLIVQFAGMFVNRLLPAGLGAMSVSFAYLLRQRHNKAQAASVVLLNNSLGVVGHIMLLSTALLINRETIQPSKLHLGRGIYFTALFIAVFITAILWFKKLRNFAKRQIKEARKALSYYKSRSWKLLLGVLFSIGITVCYAGCLLACIHAVGLSLSFTKVLIVLTAGIAGGTAVPTPGGLGAIEAALVGALVAYGFSSSDAFAAALTYRMFTFWIPLFFGGFAFVTAKTRRLI